jgi:hypothetical protein
MAVLRSKRLAASEEQLTSRKKCRCHVLKEKEGVPRGGCFLLHKNSHRLKAQVTSKIRSFKRRKYQ